MPQRPNRLASALAIAFAACAASAIAADVVVQPKVGSSLIVTDAGGTQMRLRVNESGEITMPVLVNGAQQNLPACVSTTGQLGPCAPGVVGVGPQGPAGPPGPAGGTGPTGPQGPASIGSFALPYAGSTVTSHAAFSVSNTEASTGVGIYGLGGAGSGMSADSGAGVWGDSSVSDGVLGSSKDGVGVLGNGANVVGVRGMSTNGRGVEGYSSNGYGVYASSAANYAVYAHGINAAAVHADSRNADAIQGISTSGTGTSGSSTTGFGVFGHSDSNYAFATDGPAQQALNQGGWVKAMVQVNPEAGAIVKCFNSQLPANIASVPPCGIALNVNTDFESYSSLTFPFSINSLLILSSVSAGQQSDNIGNSVIVSVKGISTNDRYIAVHMKDLDSKKYTLASYYLFLF